jgi:hypothetical protein
MARRKPKYPNPPYVVSPEAKRRFEILMKKVEPFDRPPIKGAKKWELWRWDTLEDVPQI